MEKGGFSASLTDCEMFKFAERSKMRGYIGSSIRTDPRDKIIEAYLKSKALGVNGSTLIMSSKPADKIASKVKESTTLRDFLEILKVELADPFTTIYEVVKGTNIKPLTPIGKDILDINVAEVEESVKLYIELKGAKKPQPEGYSWEGRYECKEGSSNKFWVIHQKSNGFFEASWGKNGHMPQGTKEYTREEALKLVREKTTRSNKPYAKV